jgi:hypothetical protein
MVSPVPLARVLIALLLAGEIAWPELHDFVTPRIFRAVIRAVAGFMIFWAVGATRSTFPKIGV